jgi:hypothetical protein
MIKCTTHVQHRGEKRSAYKVLVGKPKGKRLLGRPGCRWEVTIKMDLYKIELEEVDWINLAQNRDQCLVNTAAKLQFPLNAGNFLSD